MESIRITVVIFHHSKSSAGIHSKGKKGWAKEASQWVKGLPGKSQDLSLDPENLHKAICMHNHSPSGAREEAHSGDGNAQKLAGPLADLVYSVRTSILASNRWKVKAGTHTCVIRSHVLPRTPPSRTFLSLVHTQTHKHTQTHTNIKMHFIHICC